MQDGQALPDMDADLSARRLVGRHILYIRILLESRLNPAQLHLLHLLSRRVAFLAVQQLQHLAGLYEPCPEAVLDDHLHAFAHKPLLGLVQHGDRSYEIAEKSQQQQYEGQLLYHLSCSTSMIWGT